MEEGLTLGINGWRMHGLRTGVARYLSNIVSRWDREHTADFRRIRFYTGRPLDRSAIELPANIEPVLLRSRLPMIPWENLHLARQSDDDVLFAPSHSIPLWTGGKTVVAIHDALLHLHPERFPWTARQFHDRLYGWSGRHATLVITDSNAAAADIARSYGVPGERIRVVYLAADEVFRRSEARAFDMEGARRHVGSNDPYFLFVGKMSGRRDIPTLFEGFAEFIKRRSPPQHRLVLAGSNSHGLELNLLAQRAGIAERVVFVERPGDADLGGLYAGAVALISPSVYETVCLPVLEAQAAGTPVICIDSAGMREIAGDGAIYLPHMETDEIAAAMEALAASGDLTKELASNGLRSSARFSWDRCAKETLDVMREAATMERPG
ncbi:MAG: glycosyltransferase family 1 protein [Acidobacteriota bacterium]